VKVTLNGKNETNLGVMRGIGFPDLAVEISDLDVKRLFYVEIALTKIGERKVEHFELRRPQQVIMRILLRHDTLDYMVRVEGALDFSPAPKLQGPQ